MWYLIVSIPDLCTLTYFVNDVILNLLYSGCRGNKTFVPLPVPNKISENLVCGGGGGEGGSLTSFNESVMDNSCTAFDRFSE